MNPEKEQNQEEISFREEALHNFSAYEKANISLPLIPKYELIFLSFFAISIFMLVIWSFTGVVKFYVEGEGILMPKDRKLFTATPIKGPGIVESIPVTNNQSIKKGETLAVLSLVDLTTETAVLESHYQLLQNKYTQFLQDREKFIQALKDNYEKQNKTYLQSIEMEEGYQTKIKEVMKHKQYLINKKLATDQDLLELETLYAQSHRELQNDHLQFYQNEIAFQELILNWGSRNDTLETQVQNSKLSYEVKKKWLETAQKITAPADGVIVGINKNIGENIKEGEVFAIIKPHFTAMMAILYLPWEDGKKVKEGMKVYLTPSVVKNRGYGYVLGEIVSISPFPISNEDKMSTLRSDISFTSFEKSGGVLSAIVKLYQSPRNNQKLLWTTNKGDTIEITAGTKVYAQIEVENRRPITLVFPFLKELFGW